MVRLIELQHDWAASHPRQPRRCKGGIAKGWADPDGKAACGVFLASPKLDTRRERGGVILRERSIPVAGQTESARADTSDFNPQGRGAVIRGEPCPAGASGVIFTLIRDLNHGGQP